jgi:peptide/nickel transport system substrate-binding protein
VALVLVLLLVVLAGTAIGPSFAPAATPSPSPTPAPAVGHVEGVLGRPSSITPLTARTQADRDLVALLFRGLVRLGPGTSILPDLADSWTVGDKGATWTFHLRDGSLWHDGVPVSSADVVYTIQVLQDPGYDGALGAAWAGVRVTAVDERTVRFELGDPVGGFLQAATLPLLPAHLLADVPASALADDAYARQPIGNGSFALVSLTDAAAVLEPVLPSVVEAVGPAPNPAPGALDPRTPRLARLELRFFDTAEALAAAFAAGEVGSAADLPGTAAMSLVAATPGTRAIRYPGTTLTAVAFDLRSPKGSFADKRVRRALAAALDRAALIDELLGGAGARADTPIPPSSWAYDAKAAPPIVYDRTAAADGLKAAGWKRVDRQWYPPGAKKPLEISLLAPERSANPVVYEAARRVAASWTALGLATTVEALDPGEFVARLRAGDFTAAVVDVNMGLDPDPYPILGSTQVREGGSNIAGFQDAALDAALLAARAPGSMAARRKAYGSLQQLLGSLQPMVTLFFRDTVFVVGANLAGPVPRPVADPGDRFWDVVRWIAGR